MIDIRIPWPDWEVKRKIGSGSFGSVYEIERKDRFGHIEKSALKVISIPKEESDIYVLKADGYDEEGMTTFYEVYLQSVMNEYALMADLNGHPNIVSCLDRKAEKQENGIGWNIYIRMELLTSFHMMSLGKVIGEEETIKISRDLCSALIACHERNIIHRDIKPENIFVTKYGAYKLGDFGVAKIMSHTTNATRTGTPYYMAPEVCKDEPYGKEADIYSLGLVMYWLMNKRRLPFLPTDHQPTGFEKEKAYKRRVMEEEIPEPAEGSKELKRIILKATAYDPKDRYHSAEDMLRDLESLQKEAKKPEEAVIVEEPYEEETDQTLDIYHAPELKKDAEKEQVQEEEPVTEQNQEPEEITGEEEPIKEEIDATVDVYQAERLRRKAERKQTEEEEKTAEEQKLPEDNTESVSESTCEDSAEDTDGESIPEHEEEKIPEKTNETIGKSPEIVGQIEQPEEIVIQPEAKKPDQKKQNANSNKDNGNKTIYLLLLAVAVFICGVLVLRNPKKNEPVADIEETETDSKEEETDTSSTNDTVEESIPSKWMDIKAISAGHEHTVGLKKDGTVVAVGSNISGKTLTGGKCDLSDWTDIIAIAAGHNRTVGLKSDGTVITAGGSVGNETEKISDWTDIIAIAAGDDHTVGLKKDGTVIAAGRDAGNRYGFCDVSDWRDIIAIAAGDKHTVGLRSDGTVVAVGDNDRGQCDVSDWKDIIAISAGGWHTAGLKSDGTVVAVGTNNYGQCDVSDWKDISAISANYYNTVGIKRDGTVVIVGDNLRMLSEVSDWKDIIAISAGPWHIVGLKRDGTVVAVGDNWDGKCDVYY